MAIRRATALARLGQPPDHAVEVLPNRPAVAARLILVNRTAVEMVLRRPAQLPPTTSFFRRRPTRSLSRQAAQVGSARGRAARRHHLRSAAAPAQEPKAPPR